MWRYSIIFLLAVGVSCHSLAQNVTFVAAPSASRMGIKDQIQLTFTISNANNVNYFNPTSFGDFVLVQGPFQQNSYTFSNGVQSTSESLTYILQPRHEGNLTVPGAVARDAAGHTYQSNAVTIQVVPGSLAPQRRPASRDPFADDDDMLANMMKQMQQMDQQMQQRQHQRMQQMQQQQPQQAQQAQQAPPPDAASENEVKKDLFIKVAVDKNKVHVGEQITATYKLYSCIPMQVNISKLPSLNGFWTQDFDIPRQPKPVEEIIDGKKYQVFVLKKSAMFPQQSGNLELDPAEAKGMARIVQQVRRKISDIFGNGTLMMNDPVFNSGYYNAMAYKDVSVHLQSTPVKIIVTALPEKNKPAGYGGAVGSFTINDKIDKQELTTDDIATLTINITGSGNLKLIEAPKPDLPNGISTYDPQILDTITGRSTTISGTKIITYAITPHTAGDYDIPAISFTYFNPQTGGYVTEHTQPLKLHVKPGKHYNPGKNAGNNSLALKDIHDIIKHPLANVEIQRKPLLLTISYWSVYALPLLVFIGIIGWKRRDEELSKDTVKLRSKRANKVALQRLVTAKKLLTQERKTPFYEEVSKAIWLYLSDKMNIPLSALSRDAAMEAMNRHNVPEYIQKNIESVVRECETALYASGGSQEMKHTYDEAIKVISDLEDIKV